IVRTILQNPDSIVPMRDRARAAALAQSWDKTIGPLADFCANPTVRRNKSKLEADSNHPVDAAKLVPTPPNTTARQSFFQHKGKIAGNLVYFPARLLSKYLHNYFKV